MIKEITLKPATMSDAAILLQWRNDPETRKQSHDQEEVALVDHHVWLSDSLQNLNRKLFIAWQKTMEPFCSNYNRTSIIEPIGTIRTDYEPDVYELSWTIAPEFRRKGIGKKIVCMIANHLSDKNIRAEIKSNNLASVKIALHCDMKINFEEGNILHYFRGKEV